MGTFLRLFWGSASDDNKVDPATGLTAKQKKIVQSTWATLRKNPVATGTTIMSALFKKHPEYQELFPAFKDVPLEELPANKRFQAHSGSVVTALNNIIDSLNDPGLLEANLLTLGERHGQRGQTKQQFENLKQVLVDVLREALGSKFTADAAEAWSKTLDAAYAHIFKGLPA